MKKIVRNLAESVDAVFGVLNMGTKGRPDCVVFTEDELERFVDLIIKEVIAEFYDEIQYNFSSGYAQEITDSVKQRFGA